MSAEAMTMTLKPEPRRASPGQVAAAKLLLKREREGKVTIEITDRIREIAAQDSSAGGLESARPHSA